MIICVIKQQNIYAPLPRFYILKNWDIFTQIQQIRPYQRPVVARFKDTYAPTARKYFSN